MEEDLRNSPCLWPRDDGTDGRTVQLIQTVLDQSLKVSETSLSDIEYSPILVVCHTYKYAMAVKQRIIETAKERDIPVIVGREQNKIVVFDLDIIFCTYATFQESILGKYLTAIYLDNAVNRFRIAQDLEWAERYGTEIIHF